MPSVIPPPPFVFAGDLSAAHIGLAASDAGGAGAAITSAAAAAVLAADDINLTSQNADVLLTAQLDVKAAAQRLARLGSADTIEVDCANQLLIRSALRIVLEAPHIDVGATAGDGFVLIAPNGTRYLVTVSNAGAIVVGPGPVGP